MLEDRQLILRARLLCFWEEIKSLRTEIIFFSVVNYTNRPRLDSRDHELNYPCSIVIGFLHVRDFFILEERGALSLRSWIHSLNSVLSYIVLRSCIASMPTVFASLDQWLGWLRRWAKHIIFWVHRSASWLRVPRISCVASRQNTDFGGFQAQFKLTMSSGFSRSRATAPPSVYSFSGVRSCAQSRP